MKKLLFTLVALLATMTTFAQTNLTSGKTVVPLGGLKNFQPVGVVTEDNLQKITTDGNTGNVFLFPENSDNLEANKALGIQGFYIDLGTSKSIGAIQSTWEGADCGANIYVTDTEPAADGTLTGETLIATFTNAQEATKNAAIEVANSGRYIVFVPTEATNYSWGVKIRTFVALEKQASVLTTLEVSPSMVKVGEATEMTFTAKDQLGLVLTEGVTYTATNATLEGTTLTATAVGDVVITATMGENSATATIKAINVSAPTENPTEPTDLAANVIAVYSAKYDKGINESNPTWGVGGGAPNPLYTSVEEVEIANGHKVVHVKGTGFNSRTAGGVGITSDYTKIHVALYPFTATEAKLFGDNAYGDALTVENLVPGQWNYVEIDNPGNQPNYMLVELVGETEFYLDHFYFAKPAADDSEAPTLETAELVSAGIGSATLKLKATDDKSAQVTYVISDGTKDYTTKGDNGTEITYTIGGLAFDQAYTLSIVAQDDNENKSAAQQIEVTTLALTAAPAPTQAAADVISIYSNAYTGTGYAYGGWGQSTVVADEQVDNDDMLKLTNYNYLGFEFTTQLDLSEMEYLHIDVLPLQDMSLGITPIMTGAPTENSTSVGTLVPGQWNSCDIKLSDLGLDYANYKAFQLKLDKGTGTEIVYVDNIYFWKSAGGEVPTTEITAITVTAEATSIEAGATTQLTVTDQDNNVVAADKVTFSSSDETVATVNENGVVTGVAAGTATITATLNSDETIKNTVEITVTAAAPVATSGEGSYLIPSGVNAGKELKYSWAFSQTGMDVTVTFALTGTDEIAGIVDGYVFNKTDGFQEIGGLTYTWTNCTEGQTLTAAHKWMFAEGDFVTPDYSYTVKESQGGEVPVGITAITVAAETASIEADATTQLTVKDQDNNAVAADQVTFSSSDETVATVNENGVVTGVAEGSAIITATLNSDETIKNTVEITVTAAAPVATSGEGSYTIPSGVNAGKELKYSWAFSQTGMDVTVTFALTGTDEIAGIVDGYVFNKTDGFQEIGGLTYTWTNCTEGQTLTAAHKWMFAEGDFVTPDYSYTVKESQGGEVPVGITAITVAAETASIEADATTQLTVKDQDNNAIAADQVTFSSSDETVATVDENGVVTGVAAGTATITATLNSDETIKNTVEITVMATSEELPEPATVPAETADDVLAIYSEVYEAALNLTDVGSGNKGAISNSGWNGGYDTAEEKTLAANDNTVKVTDAVCFGVQAGTADITDYDFLNVAIWSTIDFTGHIQIEGTGMTNLPISLEANKWNYVKVELSGARTGATWIQLYVGAADNKNTIFVDNIYFSKLPAGELIVGEPDTQGVVALKGELTNENKSALESLDAAVIDLTGVKIEESVTAIKTANPNVFFIVPGTVENNVATSDLSDQLAGNLIVKRNDGYYFPISQLEIVDDGQSPVWTGFFVSTNTVGYTYSRTIPAGEYTTAYLPAASTAVEGLKVYTFKSYENSQIELEEKTDGVVPANTPVVLYNATDADLTIKAEGTGDLNFGGTPATVEQGGATFTGNYKVEEAEDLFTVGAAASAAPARRAQSGSTLTVKAVEGKTVPFRAYFKGVTEGEDISTAIDGLRVSRTLNGKAYTLDGREVNGTLQKGIYIIDGKKVVIK